VKGSADSTTGGTVEVVVVDVVVVDVVGGVVGEVVVVVVLEVTAEVVGALLLWSAHAAPMTAAPAARNRRRDTRCIHAVCTITPRLLTTPASSHFDEDALPRAFLYSIEYGVEILRAYLGHRRRTGRKHRHPKLITNKRQAIHQGEDWRAKLLAESVAGTEILVDPYLHITLLALGSAGT
jgi:hypothetical protein